VRSYAEEPNCVGVVCAYQGPLIDEISEYDHSEWGDLLHKMECDVQVNSGSSFWTLVSSDGSKVNNVPLDLRVPTCFWVFKRHGEWNAPAERPTDVGKLNLRGQPGRRLRS
jgi:hypothetical protein